MCLSAFKFFQRGVLFACPAIQREGDIRWNCMGDPLWTLLVRTHKSVYKIKFLQHCRWNNEKGAENLCKQLGYQTGVKYTASGGTGSIVAGNRICAGGEATVYECKLIRSETTDCTHNYDQGVQCAGKTIQ